MFEKGPASLMLGTASSSSHLYQHPHLKFILFTTMAYTMRTLAPSTSCISARPAVLSARSSRCVGGRARLVIEAKTVWQLAGQGGKEEINLTDAINTQKSFTSVGDKKHQDAEQVFGSDAGVYVVFEAKGETNAVDSPSELYITDKGSETEIKVDGKPLEKNKEMLLSIGAMVMLGDKEYQVVRDVEAHA